MWDGRRRCPWLTGYLNDIHQLDLATLAWTDLTQATTGAWPAPRANFVFATARGAAGAESLLIFGGQSSSAQGAPPSLPAPSHSAGGYLEPRRTAAAAPCTGS